MGLGGNINGSFQTKNLWSGHGGINRNRSSLSVKALRGGPAIIRPGRTPMSGAGRPPIGASLDQQTVSLTARLNYTFRPNLSLQFYAQPFISTGEYSDFKEVADPRAARFDERFYSFADPQIAYDADQRT